MISIRYFLISFSFLFLLAACSGDPNSSAKAEQARMDTNNETNSLSLDPGSSMLLDDEGAPSKPALPPFQEKAQSHCAEFFKTMQIKGSGPHHIGHAE